MSRRLVQIKMATLYFSKFTFWGSNSRLTVIKHSVSCHINLSAIKLENYFSPTLKWGADILPKNCINFIAKFSIHEALEKNVKFKSFVGGLNNCTVEKLKAFTLSLFRHYSVMN